MNKEELLKILLEGNGDYETHHMKCDDALLEYINDEEITEAFNERTKWYS